LPEPRRITFFDCAGQDNQGESVLRIQDRRDGDRHTLFLKGELDMASAPELEGRVEQAFSQSASELVLDLTQLEFIDSSGLNAILNVRTLCREHTCDFALTPGARPVQRLFEITRLIDRLPFREPSRDQHAAPGDSEASPKIRRADPDGAA
jgi:anti-sigma B factor antagonist